MRIALVFPRCKYRTGDPPLGLAYVAAALRTTAEVRIIDATFHNGLPYIEREIATFLPDVVGVYSDSLMYGDAIAVCLMAKEYNAYVVVGGPHASVRPWSFRDYAHSVVIGEGESVLPSIVAPRLSEHFTIWPPKRVVDLNRLFPAWDLLEMEKYIAHWYYLDMINPKPRGTNIVAGRGCPYKCSFCQPTLKTLFGPPKRRSPGNVVAEILKLQEYYDINAIFFHDDTFTVSRPWIYELCDKIERSCQGLQWACNIRADTVDYALLQRMREVGLRSVHMGIESASPRILNGTYNKGITLEDVERVVEDCNENDISVLGFFMLGAPGETKEEMGETIQLAHRLPIQEATFSICCPLPGTNLYDEVVKSSTLSEEWTKYNYYSSRPFEDIVSTAEIKRMQRKALLLFYLHPRRWRYIANHISSVSGWRKMIAKLRRFF